MSTNITEWADHMAAEWDRLNDVGSEFDIAAEIERLEARRVAIRQRNSHWLSCQDGSYEMALSAAGYDDVVAQIAMLKQMQGVK